MGTWGFITQGGQTEMLYTSKKQKTHLGRPVNGTASRLGSLRERDLLPSPTFLGEDTPATLG